MAQTLVGYAATTINYQVRTLGALAVVMLGVR